MVDLGIHSFRDGKVVNSFGSWAREEFYLSEQGNVFSFFKKMSRFVDTVGIGF